MLKIKPAVMSFAGPGPKHSATCQFKPMLSINKENKFTMKISSLHIYKSIPGSHTQDPKVSIKD